MPETPQNLLARAVCKAMGLGPVMSMNVNMDKPGMRPIVTVTMSMTPEQEEVFRKVLSEGDKV